MLFFFTWENLANFVIFTARGWLWSSNGLQKWKAEAICDRSCIPLFSLGWNERKVRAFWIGQRKILRSKISSICFHWKFNENGKFWDRKIFDIFSDRKFSIFSTGFSMKNFRWKFLIFLSRNFRWSIQNALTFRSDHPRRKSGIQLRSQIAWTFHFWSPFYDQRHPLAVRLQSLPNYLRNKKTHIFSSNWLIK